MRKVCVITGSRADYGLLYWLLREIQDDPGLLLQLVATGMHLSPEFGLTVRQIEDDGFVVDERVEVLLSSDSPVGVAKATGLGVIGFADALQRLAPDVVVLLGDRFEIFSAAQAAMIAKLPIAHLHGGEATFGAIDDAIRHAITKMAQFHFVAAQPFRRRVIQLGERPDRVWVVGAPGLDHLKRSDLLDREALEREIGFEFQSPTLLVTYHPATLDRVAPAERMVELLAALDRFPHAQVLFTKSNADTHGRVLNRMIDAWVAERPERARAYTSLGQRRYLSALRQVDAVVGNSSSGIIEAPAVPVPTVNLGSRQEGRLRAPSVIDCGETRGEIVAAVEKAISPGFRAATVGVTSPYGDGGASVRIRDHLKTVPLQDAVRKGFHDLDFEQT